MTDFRDTLYTIDTRGSRKWVYPSIVEGFYRRRRKIIICLLIAVYILMPWIVLNGEQAVRFNIIERKFTLLGLNFQATETFYLFLLLGTSAFSLFFFTALFGRVWCGWACPETVFLEFVYRPIERLIEGDAAARMRLDKAAWSINKFLKKGTKLLIYLLISWILASTALAYFVGRDELLGMMIHSPADHPYLFIVTALWTAGLVFQFGWFREQFCTVVCPYARFQSALLDSDSLVISYDTTRGEPRGKGSDKGDCIDCGLCVRVCPTGIDIRNGLQLECVQCTGCIDACDSIMDKLGRPQGLIRYTTEKTLKGAKSQILRPRVFIYGAIIAAYLLTFAFSITNRRSVDFQIIRASKEAPFTVDSTNTVTNHYRIHFFNRQDQTAQMKLIVLEPKESNAVVPVSPYPVAALSDSDLPLFIRFPKSILKSGKGIVLVQILDGERLIGEERIPIIGPDL